MSAVWRKVEEPVTDQLKTAIGRLAEHRGWPYYTFEVQVIIYQATGPKCTAQP